MPALVFGDACDRPLMDSRLATLHPIDPGPRPTERTIGTEHGVRLVRCESLEEMHVRVAGLRHPGDNRSVERILYAHDDTRAKGWRSYRDNGSKNE